MVSCSRNDYDVTTALNTHKGQHSFLSRAALDGDVARVAELLEGGADPDGGLSAGPSGMFGSGSPLFYASENGYVRVRYVRVRDPSCPVPFKFIAYPGT